MKLALLATPYTHPTSPPLGPAVLSAYLQQRLPGITVSIFDLSLEYYLKSFEKIQEGSLGIRLYNWNEKTTADNIHQAVSFLNDWRPSHAGLQEYHHWSTIFLSFETVFNAFMAEMAEKALKGEVIPKAIDAFFEELIQPVLKTRPDLIGFSILYQQQVVFAALLAKLIRQKSRVKIVVGGATLSVMSAPEKLLITPLVQKEPAAPEILCKDYFDYLIPGEGELALYRLCQAQDSTDLRNIPSLIYFKDNELQINPPDTAEIRSFPHPDFSQFKLDKYLTPEPVLPLMTSRGCPWGKCSFCTHHHSYLRYRTRSIKDCVAEIKFLQKEYNCRMFYFYDEMIPAGRFKMLAETILDEQLEISYGAYAKPVKSFTYTLCRLLERSGCRVLQWGVESASQRILNLMSKGTDINEVATVLSNSSRAGISNLIFILFGFPSETGEELQNTLAFLNHHREDIHALSSGTFVMTEGSRVHREPENFSISSIWEKQHSSLLYPALDYDVSRGMSAKEVRQQLAEQQKFLNEISISPRFGTYREHLLTYCSRKRV